MSVLTFPECPDFPRDVMRFHLWPHVARLLWVGSLATTLSLPVLIGDAIAAESGNGLRVELTPGDAVISKLIDHVTAVYDESNGTKNRKRLSEKETGVLRSKMLEIIRFGDDSQVSRTDTKGLAPVKQPSPAPERSYRGYETLGNGKEKLVYQVLVYEGAVVVNFQNKIAVNGEEVRSAYQSTVKSTISDWINGCKICQ